MKNWQLQEAKMHFSEVVREALANGPQSITLRGKPSVVLISQAEYDQLTKPRSTFVEFMRSSPLVGVELEINRDQDMTRETDL